MDKEKCIFKIRVFTPDLRENLILVGHNIFTKEKVLYEKQMFHMPWYQTRYMNLKQKNIDIKPLTVETEGGTYEVVIDAAVSWKILPPTYEPNTDDELDKPSFINKWRNFFKGRPVRAIIGTAATVVAGFTASLFLTPWLLIPIIGIPVINVSMGEYHTQKWLKKQAAIKAAYQEDTGIRELEQTIQEAITKYYSGKKYNEIKSNPFNIGIIYNDPNFASTKAKIETISRTYGIHIVSPGVTIKSADYTEESNNLIQEQKRIELARERKKQETDARKERLTQEIDALVSTLRLAGLTDEEISQNIKNYTIGLSGGTIIAGNAHPFVNINPNNNDNNINNNINTDDDTNTDENQGPKKVKRR